MKQGAKRDITYSRLCTSSSRQLPQGQAMSADTTLCPETHFTAGEPHTQVQVS